MKSDFNSRLVLVYLIHFCLKQDWKTCFIDIYGFNTCRFLINFNVIFYMVLHKRTSYTLMCGYSNTPEILAKDYCFNNLAILWKIDHICWFIPRFVIFYVFNLPVLCLNYYSFISLNLSKYLSSQNVWGFRILGWLGFFPLWLLSFLF